MPMGNRKIGSSDKMQTEPKEFRYISFQGLIKILCWILNFLLNWYIQHPKYIEVCEEPLATANMKPYWEDLHTNHIDNVWYH